MVTCSARTGEGVDELWSLIAAFAEAARNSGGLARRRQEQDLAWMHAMIAERLREDFYRDERVRKVLAGIEEELRAGRIPATEAAWRLLAAGGAGPSEH